MVNKTTRGGSRKGAGAKPKYNEKTTTVSFRCPISKIDELKFLLRAKLSEWQGDATKVIFNNPTGIGLPSMVDPT